MKCCAFLQLFRPLLNISLEFSAEEFETALLTPNETLFHIHMPLLKVGFFFFFFMFMEFHHSSVDVGINLLWIEFV